MGFLKLGERSIPSRTRSLATAATDADSNAQSSMVDGDSAGLNDITSSPPPRQFSPIERLPVELLQRIFILSRNPNLPLVSHTLLGSLSSPYICQLFFASTVLDDSIPTHEYRRAVSTFLTRRFVTPPFLERVEDILWNKKYNELFCATFPSPTRKTPWNTGFQFTGSPEYNRWWYVQSYITSPLDDNGGVGAIETEYVEAGSHRMIDGKLDLRSVPFPNILLLPPFKKSRFEIIREIMYRNPDAYVGVSSGSRAQAWSRKVLEMAIRARCGSMVYLLTHHFYVQIEAHHVKLALLPPDYGDIASLAPDFTPQQATISTEEDMNALEIVKSAQGRNGATHPPKRSPEGFLQVMSDWKSNKKECDPLKQGWPKHTQEMEDSLRILWIFEPLYFADSAEKFIGRNSGALFPTAITSTRLVRDEEIWEAAIKQRGPLLDWLVAVGKPAASLLRSL
ncbi:hypothetical protein ABW19_dt0200157 [Dactylella cylindrospora]|nr:hypothetical protein ABW19_dt0200157 [Dactylella cylindrospora]